MPAMGLPTNASERMDHLRRVPLLTRLDNGSMVGLFACLKWRALEPGVVLFAEGDPGDTMVFVTEGTLATTVRHASGSFIEVGRSGVGETLGEMTCIDPAPRSATVTAVSHSVVAELSRDGLEALQRAVPSLATLITGEVIRVVTRRMRELEARIDQELGGPAQPPAHPQPGPAPAGTPAKVPLGSTPPPPPRTVAPPPIEGSDGPRRSGFWGILDRLRGGT